VRALREKGPTGNSRKRAGVVSGFRPDARQGRGPDQVGAGQAGKAGPPGGVRRLEVCDGEECARADSALGTGTGEGDQPGRRAERAETV